MESGKAIKRSTRHDPTLSCRNTAAKRPNALEWLQQISAPFVVIPDVTYFLAVPPEAALDRIRGRPKKVRFEELGLLAAVDANYRQLAKEPRFVTVEATRGVEDVTRDVLEDLRGRLR